MSPCSLALVLKMYVGIHSSSEAVKRESACSKQAPVLCSLFRLPVRKQKKRCCCHPAIFVSCKRRFLLKAFIRAQLFKTNNIVS